MRPRTAALLLLSVAGLFLVGVGLSIRLLRAGLNTARLETEQRLKAIGLTAAQALAQGSAPAFLEAVARDNDLEAAYLLDATLRPLLSGGKTGLSVNLLRIDPDRALRALSGEPSVAAAYILEATDAPIAGLWTQKRAVLGNGGLDDSTVLAGYFPIAIENGTRRLLVLEAGQAFVALPAQLRATAWAAGATAFGLSALCALLIFAALRSATREQRLRQEAERGELLRELAAMVAHELRNPLGTIRAGAELLREQAANPDLVADILAEVTRLSTLATQFLQFSRDPPLSVAPIDLGALCDELCARLRREYPHAAGLRICREGDESVPLAGDADRLRQVLYNLAQNAVQAMKECGELHISACRGKGGGVEVRVRDTGPGVSSEAKQALFVPFRTTKPSGTGLGLLISRRIVEKHGGSLSLLDTPVENESEPAAGPGACFVVRLPPAPPS